MLAFHRASVGCLLLSRWPLGAHQETTTIGDTGAELTDRIDGAAWALKLALHSIKCHGGSKA